MKPLQAILIRRLPRGFACEAAIPHDQGYVTRCPLTKLLVLSLALAGANVCAQPAINSQAVFGGSGNQQGMGIAVSGGNVYFSGQNNPTADPGVFDGLLGKYNGALTSQAWIQPLGGYQGSLTGIAVSNNVYASGFSRPPSLTIDTVGGWEHKGLTASTGLSGGAYAWRTQTPAAPGFFPYGGSEFLRGIAVSSSGGTDSIYVVGVGEAFSTYGWPNYGMGLAKLSETGSVLATARYGGGSYADGHAVTTLSNNVYAVGEHGALAFIRAYDSNLVNQWTGETLAGKFNSVNAFGGDLYAAGSSGVNGLVARYSTSGSLLWSQTFSAGALTGIVGLNSHLYAVGGNGSDGVLLDIDPLTGSLLSSQTFGGSGVDSFTGVAANLLDGSLYAIGSTSSFGANGQDIWIAHFTNPVPEPETYAMLLAGLGLLGFAARRRKQKESAVA